MDISKYGSIDLLVGMTSLLVFPVPVFFCGGTILIYCPLLTLTHVLPSSDGLMAGIRYGAGFEEDECATAEALAGGDTYGFDAEAALFVAPVVAAKYSWDGYGFDTGAALLVDPVVAVKYSWDRCGAEITFPGPLVWLR